VLKNSFAKITLENRRARMPYKRFSPTAHTFLVTHFEAVFRKPDFFNSHGCYRQLWGMANARLGVTGAIMLTSYRQPWRSRGNLTRVPGFFPGLSIHHSSMWQTSLTHC
jgi:hypothetical protein